MIKNILSVAVFLICFSANAQQSCANYPYDEGIDIQIVEGGYKILATAQVSVSMDDIDSIKDAREEATIEAKAAIVKFLTETPESDSSIDRAVNESKQADGQSVQVNRKELVTRVKRLRNSGKSLLRGVVALGSCYTKAREFRVTVGLKPETIRLAEQISGNINSSISSQNSAGGGASNGRSLGGQTGFGASQSLRGMDGHSNTDRMNNF